MMTDQNTQTGSTPGAVETFVSRLRRDAPAALISGLGAALVIGALAQASEWTGALLLIAPFGASSVLLFALPQSPLARPRNVILGHFISALMGLIVLTAIGPGALSCAIGVGLAIAAMQLTATLHPPAGGTPLVVILTGAGWQFLLVPILVGTAVLVGLAWAYHRFVSSRPYPGPD